MFAIQRNSVFCVLMSCGLMASVAAAEAPRQAPLELPKELMPAEAAPVKKPLPKSIKLAKADIPPEATGAAVSMPVASASKPVVEDIAAVPVWKTHTVVAGDTLDKVVKKYYANSPLKPEVLQDWVMVNNPKAFTKVKTKKLQPGTVLNLADQADLIYKLMPNAASKASAQVPNSPPANPLPAPVGGASAHQSGSVQALVEPNKRNWVRYP